MLYIQTPKNIIIGCKYNIDVVGCLYIQPRHIIRDCIYKTQKHHYRLYIQTPKNINICCIYKHQKTSLQVVYTNTQKLQYMLYIQTPKNIIIGCKYNNQDR